MPRDGWLSLLAGPRYSIRLHFACTTHIAIPCFSVHLDGLCTVSRTFALLAPLVAAGAIALSAMFQARRLARHLAMGGAAISFVAASVALVRLWNGGSDGETTLNLGVWLSSGTETRFNLHSRSRWTFRRPFWRPSPPFAPCAHSRRRIRMSEDTSESLVSIGASLLLSSSLGIVFSANVGELFVFWQIAAFSSYLMLSAAAETGPEAAAAKKFMMMQRCAEFWLLCAVLAFAVAYRTLDYDDLLGYLRFQGASRFALVHFIGLCLLGACGAGAPVPISGLDRWACLRTCRRVPARRGNVLDAGGGSASHPFFAGTARSGRGVGVRGLFGRSFGFFCGDLCLVGARASTASGISRRSIFGFIVLGLSLPEHAAAAWSVVLTAGVHPDSDSPPRLVRAMAAKRRRIATV